MNRGTALLLAALAGVAAPAVARADKLDARLHEEAPKVVQKLLDKKYHNVGVLRFQVEAPGIKPSYTTPLSGNLVTRVETGLILHAERDGKPAIGVTRDTGTTAQKQKVGAWTTSTAERTKLFAATYPLAWGKESVKADAFITGTVKLSKDMKQTTVTLLVFDKAAPSKMEKLDEFTVPTDRNVLRDLGISYSLPQTVRARAIKLKKRGDEVDQDAVEIVGKQQKEDPKGDDKPKEDDKPKGDDKPKEDDKPKGDDKPKEDDKPKGDDKPKQKNDTGASPTDIGGVAVRMLVDDGDAIIRESATQGDSIRWQIESPEAGKKVAFEFTNKTDKKMAVVLRLNGVNVINLQKLEPEFCGKIILNPGKKAVVRGFIEVDEKEQPGERSKPKKRDGLDDDTPPKPDTPPAGGKGKMTIRPFQVLVGEDAAKARGELGDKAGLIDIDVFEAGSKAPDGEVNQRGLPPSKALKARESYKGLKTALLQSSGLKTKMESRGGVKARELIVPKPESEREEIGAGVTTFPNPAFVSRVTIKVIPREAAP